jgi:hypothetical protein
MVEAGQKAGNPFILGSSGMAGGDRNVARMLDIAKEVFAELNVGNAKVAVIGAELDPEIVIKEFLSGALRPTGLGPEISEEALRESTGTAPTMTIRSMSARSTRPRRRGSTPIPSACSNRRAATNGAGSSICRTAYNRSWSTSSITATSSVTFSIRIMS